MINIKNENAVTFTLHIIIKSSEDIYGLNDFTRCEARFMCDCLHLHAMESLKLSTLVLKVNSHIPFLPLNVA